MKVAITGNIGSGKTEVLNIIKASGFECCSADEINRKLLTKKKIQNRVMKILELDTFSTAEISIIIFSDEAKRQKLEEFLHPLILAEIEKKTKGNKLIFVEVPLLYEAKWEHFFDKVILCSVSKEVAIERLVANRGFDYQTALSRYNSQLANEGKIALADYVIDNEGDYQQLVSKVLDLLRENF